MITHISPLQGAQLGGRDRSLFTLMVDFFAARVLPP